MSVGSVTLSMLGLLLMSRTRIHVHIIRTHKYIGEKDPRYSTYDIEEHYFDTLPEAKEYLSKCYECKA